MLTGPPQRCGMAKTTARRAGTSRTRGSIRRNGYHGGQEQRSRCDVAEDGRRDGEGIQFLRQPGHGVARILQGHEPGRGRCCRRAEAARRADGEISRRHEPAEPGADGRHGRTAAVDRGPAQRDQGDAEPAELQCSGRTRQQRFGTPRPPRTKRPPSARESRNERTHARLDLASISERVQSEVQRAIQRSIKGVEYFSSSGPTLGSTPKDVLHCRGTMSLYHYRPLSDEIYRVPILIVMATTNRGYILDLVPGPELHRVPAQARLRRLHAGLDRAAAGGEVAAHGGLRPRLHPGLRPPRAGGFRRATMSP